MGSLIQRLGCRGKGKGLFICHLIHICITIYIYNEHVLFYDFKKRKRNYVNQNIEIRYITIPCICILLKSFFFSCVFSDTRKFDSLCFFFFLSFFWSPARVFIKRLLKVRWILPQKFLTKNQIIKVPWQLNRSAHVSILQELW